MLTTGPRGTKDILPGTGIHWQYIETAARDICKLYAYQEIRTPIFEHTELFLRGIGETTDIVEKEMYTFTDRGKRSITLRPENTAAVVRMFLEHKLYAEPQPSKLFYIGPMFRYDRPQAGRYRQFHQFGIEALSAPGPVVDAEVILLAVHFFQKLNLTDLRLLINSVGCPQCRPDYRVKLQEFLRPHLTELCHDCSSRFERNPMRVLDCKIPRCIEISQGAPQMLECLCDDCHEHFEGLKKLLHISGTAFTIDSRLVRGLDYYTKTAFEIQYTPLGSQSAVCGGGRYDGLVAECGGQPTPGIGFAIGLERVLLALDKQGLLPAVESMIDVYVASMGQEGQAMAFSLLYSLRKAGISADMDLMQRGIKAQMKMANRYGAQYVAIIGEEEAKQGKVMLKDMSTGIQNLIDANDVIDKLQCKVEE